MMPDTSSYTRVLFRRYPEGEIVAILLDVAANLGFVVCYVHVGQHCEGQYFGMIADTRPATPAEYAPLARELTQRGYTLDVRKRRTIRGKHHRDTYGQHTSR